MATISSPGIGSGLDVSSIITQLMAIERKPLDNLETAETKIQSQISEVGKIKSALSKFRDLAVKLASTSFWNQTTGTASNSAVSVTTGTGATAASYKVEVQTLAYAQSIASPTFASSSTTLSAGTLHIEMGTWGAGQTTFTADADSTAVDITVEATDTLASLRDKINASGAGVTATILTDASGARLVMRSNETGAENAFRTSVTPTGGTLDGFAFDPSSSVTGATLAQEGTDATALINDLPVRSASNTMNDVVDGVTLTFNNITVDPMTVTVAADSASMKKTLQDFASAYSELAKLIATDTKYDSTTKTAGALQGDSAIVGLQTRLRSMMGASSSASSVFARLSDIGFEMQQDGSLTANSTKLDKALANLSELRLAFANSSLTDPSLDGFAKRFRTITDDVLGIDGSLTSRADALADKLERNQDQQDRMEERLAQTQARIEKQYSMLDAKLGTLNSLSSFVTQQVALWSKTSSS
jgi:flagellar hook-associated protein 2